MEREVSRGTATEQQPWMEGRTRSTVRPGETGVSSAAVPQGRACS